MPTPTTGPITVPAPPTLPTPEGSSTVLTSALPMLAGFGSMVMMAGMSGIGQTRALVGGGFFLLSTSLLLGTQLVRQRRQHQQRVDDVRRIFLREIARARGEIDAVAAERRERLDAELPSLAALVGAAPAGHREHRAVRIGSAYLAPEHPPELSAPEDPDRADPVAVSAVRALTGDARLRRELPLGIDWSAWDELTVVGETVERTAFARLLLAQSAATHDPTALRVVLLAPPDQLHHWDWLKWLPHHRSEVERDVAAGRRLVLTGIEDLTPDDQCQTLLVVDGFDVVVPAATTVIRLVPRHDAKEPGAREGVVRLHGTAATWETAAGQTTFTPDRCSPTLAETVARRLDGAHRPSRAEDRPALDDLPALLGVDDLDSWTPRATWSAEHARLAVPIGIDEEHRPIVLDLKESAQGGDGPHGLVVGATGSGKSELLRTLVLGLAMTHSPDDLAMVLVDFKGGATFAGLSDLPHVSALVTNLGDDLSLVDRMADTLTGELVRRQEVLRAHGHSSLVDHREARARDTSLEAMPSLFVCIDEFSELLSARPEFIDVFVAIGRVGRSLGVHLLLASQRIEEGRLRGLETHLSYRIGLRTFSAAESRAAIGVPDAFSLPSVPGAGYLSTGSSGVRRFTAAYVSGPPPVRVAAAPVQRRPLPWTLLPLPWPPSAPVDVPSIPAGTTSTNSTVDVVVTRVADTPRARAIWLPPLEQPLSLGDLFSDVRRDPALGLHSPRGRAAPGRLVPVGVVDRPREQRRDVWTLDLSGATGHCAVVGGPRSGRTTALRTIVAGLALSATPVEAQFFLLDFGGGGLGPLATLPHVVGHGARGDDLLPRLTQEVQELVDRRETLFRDHGLDGFEAYVRARAAGRLDDGYGEVFVVVDGWGTLRADDYDLEAGLQRLAERALTFGVHLVVATPRWTDLRPAVRDLFGSRLELRLGDPAESVVHRARAATVPTAVPGRGLVADGLHLLTATPTLDQHSELTDLVAAVDLHWSGPRPARIARLPEAVDLEALRSACPPGHALLLGADGDPDPVVLDLDTERHLVVRGAHGSGRSSALRTYLDEVTRAHAPSDLQVVVVDPRGTLEGSVGHEHLLHHLVSRRQTGAAIGDLVTYLEKRVPGPDVDSDALRSRSWWSGAEVVVVIDDHDLVTAGGGQESGLHRLAPLLPVARDVGLRVVVAQRTGRGARGHDPFVQALADLDVATLDLTADSTHSRTPPGRARLTTRGRAPRVFQMAQVPARPPVVAVSGDRT